MRRAFSPFLAALAAGAALLFLTRSARASGRGDEPDWFEWSALYPAPSFDYPPIPDLPEWPIMSDGPVYDPRDINARTFDPSQMQPSGALAEWLMRKEDFRAERYELGDGGVTIGYGWYEPYSRAHLMPETITEPEARARFFQQLEERGAVWVRQYVNTPLTQNEFDALTSMAYNLSPRSFKQIADALNAGEDWQAVAFRFTRPGTHLERGLRNRRNAEIAMFEQGVYA